MLRKAPLFPARIRSFVRRDSRLTFAQDDALRRLMPGFGVKLTDGECDFKVLFGRCASTTLEIGFGNGLSLLELARRQPERNFIGIETHKPGIGALLLGIERYALNNLKIFYADALDVLRQCIPDESLQGIQLFFPDPWPKRRHYMRRIVQYEFIALLSAKLKSGGDLYLATDWDDYAKHMMKVLMVSPALQNTQGDNVFAAPSLNRPLITKFEQRALAVGRTIYDLHFKK